MDPSTSSNGLKARKYATPMVMFSPWSAHLEEAARVDRPIVAAGSRHYRALCRAQSTPRVEAQTFSIDVRAIGASARPMARTKFYIPHPTKPNETLWKKGQSWDEPILKSRDGNDFFIMTLLGDGRRALYSFDPTDGTKGPLAGYVPEHWEGEPQVDGIEHDVWCDMQVAAGQGDIAALEVERSLTERILAGDHVHVHHAGQRRGVLRVTRTNNAYTLHYRALP